MPISSCLIESSTVDINTIKSRNYDLDIKNPSTKEETTEYSTIEIFDILNKSLIKSNKLLNQLKDEIN